MKYEILRLDDLGAGITFVDDTITFVKGALPGDIVTLKNKVNHKKYNTAEVDEFIKASPDRREPLCPHSKECGGCALLSLSYEKQLEYKKNKVEHILKKIGNIAYKVKIIGSIKKEAYRNKITLHIKEGQIGFFKEGTNTLVAIEFCPMVQPVINDCIKELPNYKIKNGTVVVRANREEELLVVIDTKDAITIPTTSLKRVGVIQNGKVVEGIPSFKMSVDEKSFTMSYNSFFQINPAICEVLFTILKESIKKNKTVLDLYCGVGSLGIAVKDISKKIIGIEVIENAIQNAKMNNPDGDYYVGEVGTILPSIKEKPEVAIVDPPRAGLDHKTKEYLNRANLEQILYVSCDPFTLARDLKELSNYIIKEITCLDMFPNTYHCETICVLERK